VQQEGGEKVLSESVPSTLLALEKMAPVVIYGAHSTRSDIVVFACKELVSKASGVTCLLAHSLQGRGLHVRGGGLECQGPQGA